MQHKTEISSGGIVYKQVGLHVEWLVTQHSLHKGWSFPKGLVGDTHENESLESAALREVGEEGGIKALIKDSEPVEVKYKYRFEEFLVDKTVYYFLMEYISGDPNDHDWEVSEAKFLPEDEVLKILSFKTDKEAFKKILEKYHPTT
jgi:8-oxo-dGTP pyrophosphatase MutT (NUDIX family)